MQQGKVMNQRPLIVLLSLAPMMAAGCFLQPVNSTASFGAPETDAGLSTVTTTPPIEFDGGTTTNACDVTTSQATSILEKYCARCHSGRDESAHRGVPPFDFLFDFEKLKIAPSSVADLREGSKKMRFVAAGDPDNSRIYLRVSRGEMPPLDPVGAMPSPRPTVSDISVLREWITSCMGGSAPPPLPAPTPGVAGADGGGRADGPGKADAGAKIDAPAGGGAAPPPGAKMTFSGPVLREGGVLPLSVSSPTNQSPELIWGNAPAGTKSFAVAFSAATAGNVLWVLWDIPANVFSLGLGLDPTAASPRELPAARQQNYLGGNGFVGPEASARAAGRDYRFEIWALDVDKLNTQALGLAQGGTRATQALVDAIKMASFPGTSASINLKGNPGN
jgi:phosphatidylethanolamine-binding protein (PEBP) family uncharacterized protein